MRESYSSLFDGFVVECDAAVVVEPQSVPIPRDVGRCVSKRHTREEGCVALEYSGVTWSYHDRGRAWFVRGREGGREGEREGERERGREGGREGGRERGRERGRKKGKEGERSGERKGWNKGQGR